MTRTGRASGSGEAWASAAADRGVPQPDGGDPEGRDPEAWPPWANSPEVTSSGAPGTEAWALGASGLGASGLGATSTGATSPGSRGTEARDPEARARQICLRLLTIAPRTRAQLAQAMHRGGVPDEAAEAVLTRFTDAGLIDDAAFARAWVESRHHSRGLSKRSLSAELRRNGVQNDEIREAVDALDPEQEVDTARRLVERKLASNRGRPQEARARQAAGMLARKGYPPGLAFRLIREVMQQEGAELDEMDADAYLDPDAQDSGI
jgi:regulatory protein